MHGDTYLDTRAVERPGKLERSPNQIGQSSEDYEELPREA